MLLGSATFTLVLGLVLLIGSGELLIRGAESMTKRLKISPLVAGLTILAFATSAPELFVSINAALSESPDLIMGNIVGSNICNLTLVLGISALIYPIRVNVDSLRIDWPVAMGSSLLLFLLVQEGWISSYEGIGFLVLLSMYIFFVVSKSRSEIKKMILKEKLAESYKQPLRKNLLALTYILLGAVGLYFGSEYFVKAAKVLAKQLGGEHVIGLSIVALSTSLPELVASIIASVKKKTDMAIGNLIGSNVFNILFILGSTSLFKTIAVHDVIIFTHMPWMLGVTFIVFPIMLTRRTIGRIAGFLLLGIYIFYTYVIVF